MTAHVDPTYPLFPIVGFSAAATLLLVLLTSAMRRNWNLGVTILCFWLFWESIGASTDSILWANNADVKHHAYCDIFIHVQVGGFVARPMATLIITRRLYLIATRQAVDVTDSKMKRRQVVLELILGCFIPLLVMGPLFYIVQMKRFQVVAGIGCVNAIDNSVLGILLFWSWSIIPPLWSVCLYYPKIFRAFYRYGRFMSYQHETNGTASHPDTHSYIRVLALASVDLLLTLPVGAVTVGLNIANALSVGHVPFYSGWSHVHGNWAPISSSHVGFNKFELAVPYVSHWVPIVLAWVIFALFGVTVEARASYSRAFYAVVGWFGWDLREKALARRAPGSVLGTMEFGGGPLDVEMGSRMPSFVNPNHRAHVLDASWSSGEERFTEESKTGRASLDKEVEGRLGRSQSFNAASCVEVKVAEPFYSHAI